MPNIERAISLTSGQPVLDDVLVITAPVLDADNLVGPAADPGEVHVKVPIPLLKGYFERERSKQVRAMSADRLWRQRGRFMVTEAIVKHDPRLLLEILRGVFVFRCEFNYVAGAFEYEACSEHFDLVNPKEFVPAYQCVCTPAPVWKLQWVKEGSENAEG